MYGRNCVRGYVPTAPLILAPIHTSHFVKCMCSKYVANHYARASPFLRNIHFRSVANIKIVFNRAYHNRVYDITV